MSRGGRCWKFVWRCAGRGGGWTCGLGAVCRLASWAGREEAWAQDTGGGGVQAADAEPWGARAVSRACEARFAVSGRRSSRAGGQRGSLWILRLRAGSCFFCRRQARDSGAARSVPGARRGYGAVCERRQIGRCEWGLDGIGWAARDRAVLARGVGLFIAGKRRGERVEARDGRNGLADR
ncbi:uncharacterized protein A4U43_C04F2060 [Asparagus officinalis]|uniref:Uncharacterized protein n=1 Tax=Asparagus officinalis TaxID=4686 RepID=A0A5P1F217_ASPOF|nr:uncharacterized protein A4U43_C04F2060 [Asparagus officinalis]